MIFRRIVAGLLVFLFIAVSLVSFLVFAVSNTFLSGSFYEEKISGDTYNFMISATVKNLINENALLEKYFTEADLRREIMEVFPEDMFRNMINQLVSEMETLRQDPGKPLTLKLGTYRESLLTLAHNFSYDLFKAIPKCAQGEIPEEGADSLPTCVPESVEYNVVAAPFTEEFEKSIYAAVPEQVQIDLNATVGDGAFMMSNVFQLLDTVKLAVYATLLAILILIALLIWKPFTTVLTYEGIGFLLGGLSGVVCSYMLMFLPSVIAEKATGEMLADDIRVLAEKAMLLFSAEMQKGAYLFLALGALIVLVRLFMKKR